MRQIASQPLWIGNAGDVRDLARVRAAGIKAAVDLAVDERPLAPGREMVYYRFPLIDGGGNARWLVSAAVRSVAELLRTRTPTLVYCSGGMSRSPCVAAGAVAVVSGRAPGDCLADVVRGGPADISAGLWDAVQTAVGSARSV